MATDETNPIFGYAELTAAAGRFAAHAETIRNPARADIANDLLLAARIAHRFASFRYRVANVAARVLNSWDPHADPTVVEAVKAALAIIHRDLWQAFDETSHDVGEGA
jgi:hypothetical protein